MVVRGIRSPTIGRNWPREIKLEMMKSEKQVNSVVAGTTFVENLCEKYREIFEPGLGCLKTFEVNLAVKPNAVPV